MNNASQAVTVTSPCRGEQIAAVADPGGRQALVLALPRDPEARINGHLRGRPEELPAVATRRRGREPGD